MLFLPFQKRRKKLQVLTFNFGNSIFYRFIGSIALICEPQPYESIRPSCNIPIPDPRVETLHRCMMHQHRRMPAMKGYFQQLLNVRRKEFDKSQEEPVQSHIVDDGLVLRSRWSKLSKFMEHPYKRKGKPMKPIFATV